MLVLHFNVDVYQCEKSFSTKTEFEYLIPVCWFWK